MLIVDASIAVRLCLAGGGFESLGEDLAAPPLLWPEFRSALQQSAWRGELSRADRDAALEALANSPLREKRDSRLGAETIKLADELGWAKTYDAEYCALASLLGCRLVTLDGRLRRGADRLGFVVTPAEL